MTGIVFTSVGIVVSFIIVIVFSVISIISKIRKSTKTKKNVVLLISFSLLFFGLIATDVLLIGNNLSKYREGIVNSAEDTAMKAAELTGKGFVKTFDSVVKTWDARSIERMKNIDLSVIKASSTIKDGLKEYSVEVLFDNKNKTNAESISSHEMISSNALVFCDVDDIVYAIDSTKNETFNLPSGKSKITLIIGVEQDVKLSYIRYIEQKIPFVIE